MDIKAELEKYCKNDCRLLKAMCDPLIKKIGGVFEKDYNDFYSIALATLSSSVFSFDEEKKCKFSTYLYGNIQRKFNTEVRDRNCKKRIPEKEISSIDALVGEDGIPISELIPSKFDTYEEACGSNLEGTNMEKYLKRLSRLQRKIVMLLSAGYKPKEIREKLNISQRTYNQNFEVIQSYENTRILKHTYYTKERIL